MNGTSKNEDIFGVIQLMQSTGLVDAPVLNQRALNTNEKGGKVSNTDSALEGMG
jgi:hypothetical protein